MCVDEVMDTPATVNSLRDILSVAGVADLLAAKDEVDELLKERVAKENEAMKATIEAIAKATGVPVEKVLETLTPEKTKRTRAKRDDESRPAPVIKFRHPEKPELTWTGRGKEPNWLKDARNDFDDQELLAA